MHHNGPVTPDGDVPPLHVRVMGVTVEIAVPDTETRTRLAHQWSRAVVEDLTDEPDGHVEAPAGSPAHRDATDYALTTRVTMAALRATRGHRVNLHAGGLTDSAGRVIALVGPSGTGKTTATRLLAHRLGYLSDETVSVDPDGRVHAHAKPLSVVPDGAAPRSKRQLSPDDLDLLPARQDPRLARLLVLRRGVPNPRGLVPLDTVDGVLELVEQSSSLADLPDPLTTLVRLVEATGGVWALEYDEIDKHLDEVVELLAADLPGIEEAAPVRHPGCESPSPATDDRLARTPWKDAVEIGDDVVVLLESRAVHLHHLVATLWLALTRPRTVEELVRAAQERHGEHSDAAELVRRATEVLLEEGLAARGSLA
jgi:hypothetical protein